jgi:hypothetical protein
MIRRVRVIRGSLQLTIYLRQQMDETDESRCSALYIFNNAHLAVCKRRMLGPHIKRLSPVSRPQLVQHPDLFPSFHCCIGGGEESDETPNSD